MVGGIGGLKSGQGRHAGRAAAAWLCLTLALWMTPHAAGNAAASPPTVQQTTGTPTGGTGPALSPGDNANEGTQSPRPSGRTEATGLRDIMSRSLALPLTVSPSTAPGWLRAFLCDVDVAATPRQPRNLEEAALVRLRRVWCSGRRDLALDMLREIGTTLDHRADFVLIEAEIRKSFAQIDVLRRCLDKAGWKAMPVARNAYRFWLARDDPRSRDALTSDIVREAAAEPEARLFVGALLESWGCPEVAAEIWILVAASDHPAHDFARVHVTGLALKSGDTPMLLRLCNAIAQHRPQDADARLTRVYLSLLLRQESREILEEAKTLHAAKPDNPAVASILAYGLLRSGDRAAALKTLTDMNPSALQDRTESLMGALVLETTDPGRAHALAESSVQHLTFPEEKKLLRSVLERLPKGRVN